MSFARLHKVVAYLFAGLGLWALSIGPGLGWSAQVLIALAYALSLLAEGERIRAPSWVRGWTLGLVALLGVQILRGGLGSSMLPLALEFTAALQISRLFNRRGAAEYQQIAALSLLMLIAATVLSTELSYAVAFGGFVVAAPWMFTLGHLRGEIEANHRTPDGDLDEEAVAKVLASRQLIGPRYLLGTASLSVPLFLMTGVLFIAFPRVGLGMFSFGRSAGQQVTGFGANVELGDFGVIRSDATVVLRVTPPHLGDDPPDLVSIRMRGTSFDHYDGRRWTRSRELSAESIGRLGTHYRIPIRMPTLRDAEWHVVLDALDEPVIFLPPQTVGLQIPPRVVGSMDVGREITIAPGVDIRYEDGDGLGLRYVAYTSPDAVLDPVLDPEMARRYLQVPDGHERVAALAREWTRGATTPAAQIRAIQGHLRDSGEFTYSLSMPDVGDRLPLDVFLFEARRGHCEYYSTALAVMLRTLGIPTRNATGFLGGRFNSYGRYYALAQGDAHSWVEAWLVGHGWVTLDPTPAARGEIGPEPGLFGAVGEILDALRTRWASDVVSYDLRRQIGLFLRLRDWFRGEPDEGAAPAPREAPARASSGPSAWPFVVGGLLFVLLGWLIWRRLRGRRAARSDPLDENARRAVQLMRSLDRALGKLGWPRPTGRTGPEHVAHLSAAGFGETALVRRTVERYERARYGGEPLSVAESDRLRAEIRRMRRRRDLAP